MSHQQGDQIKKMSTHFFVKELAGEMPPTFETMLCVYRLALELWDRHPWELLNESELVLVAAPVSGEICHCSVMGALGQVYAMHAYLGPESYRFFKKLESGTATTAGEFFANQHSIYVEFVSRAELETPDGDLLRALGHRHKKGALAPVFRTIRPGYHPWYVTEAEAKVLAECLWAVITVCKLVAANKNLEYWNNEGVYPLLMREDERKYKIALAEADKSPAPIVAPVNLDEAALSRVRDSNFPFEATIELDHFFVPAMIGKRDERKACCQMALAADSKTGFVYPPELFSPPVSPGNVLVGAILQAIEVARALPREIHVTESTFKALVEPLANALGIKVRVVKSLPALASAKQNLLQMMGDSGPFAAFQ